MINAKRSSMAAPALSQGVGGLPPPAPPSRQLRASQSGTFSYNQTPKSLKKLHMLQKGGSNYQLLTPKNGKQINMDAGGGGRRDRLPALDQNVALKQKNNRHHMILVKRIIDRAEATITDNEKYHKNAKRAKNMSIGAQDQGNNHICRRLQKVYPQDRMSGTALGSPIKKISTQKLLFRQGSINTQTTLQSTLQMRNNSLGAPTHKQINNYGLNAGGEPPSRQQLKRLCMKDNQNAKGRNYLLLKHQNSSPIKYATLQQRSNNQSQESKNSQRYYSQTTRRNINDQLSVDRRTKNSQQSNQQDQQSSVQDRALEIKLKRQQRRLSQMQQQNQQNQFEEEQLDFEEQRDDFEKTLKQKLESKNELLLEDLNAENLKVKRVPQTASQTCMGQKMIRPVIDPIPFAEKHQLMSKLSKDTIKNFGLTQQDMEQAQGHVKHKYNHVQQNIKLAGKITIVKNLQHTFKKTVLAKNNTQNLKLIKNVIHEKEEVKRKQRLKNLGRWDDFRERRIKIQERYSELRKKQTLVDIFTRQILLYQLMVYLSNNYSIAHYKKEKRLMGQFLALKIQQMLRRRHRRWNIHRDPDQKKKFKFFSTIIGNAFNRSVIQRAKVILAMFLDSHIQREKIKLLGREHKRKIVFMQNRMKKQLQIRYSKVDVLLSAWQHIHTSIMRKALKRKDQAVLQLLRDIALLDSNPQIRKHLLMRYVNKCRELHSIAFLQWRLLYPTPYVIQENVEELILARISNLVNGLDFEQRPTERTLDASAIPQIMHEKYQTIEKIGSTVPMRLFRNKPDKSIHKINSFFDIGWSDPFTEESPNGLELIKSIKLPSSAEDLVYHKSRFNENYSPYVIYLPNDDVMFKLMRACLDCESKDDLWINRQVMYQY